MVHTSDLPGAGTGGGVWLEIEGLAGSSGPQDLPSGPSAFERDQVSTYLYVQYPTAFDHIAHSYGKAMGFHTLPC